MTTLTRDSVEQFHGFIISTGRSPNTARSYRADINSLVDWLELQEDQDQPLPTLIRLWLAESLLTKAAATVRRRKASASEFMDFLGVHERIRFKLPSAPPPTPKPVPGGLASVDRILTFARTAEEELLVALGAYLGLRVSESVSLTSDSYDDVNRILVIRGKGRKFRQLPINDAMHKRLVRAIHQNRGNPDKRLIGASNSTAREWITRIAREAGFDGVSSHDLRATFATDMYDRTLDVLMVQKWLGHAKPETTRAYVQTTLRAMRAVAA